ncbi:MAG: hypothetical protein LBK63_04005 [Treponema sp.]|jgi:hypothetical protein|nr:hypothetical protein [Treponema sp.]
MKQPSLPLRFFGRRFSALILLVMLLSFPAFAQSSDKPFELILGRLNFSLGTDVLEDGSQTDILLGYRYAPSAEGEIRFRYVKESYNDNMYDLEESLIANDEITFEIFLLPLRHHFFDNSTLSFNAAAGLYYDYNALNQHGYFNRTDLTPSLNTQRNDFSMHILGPIVEAGLHFQTQPVDVQLKTGIVPIFYLRRDQSMRMKPFMGDEYFDHSQDTSGSPYFYGELNGIFFKFLSLSLLYEFARIDYDVIGIDGAAKKWTTLEEELITHSLKAEASVLLSFGRGLYFKVGYGHSFDTIILNSSTPVEDNAPYLIIATEKLVF